MAVAAVGIFDGVHNGHRKVIETLVRTARERGDGSLVITFRPHPRTVLQDGADTLRLLTSFDEKKKILGDLGVDKVEVLPFTREFSAMGSEEFIRMLASEYSVSTLVLGYDTRMGADLSGPEALCSAAAKCGMETVVVGCDGSEGLSSTRIRRTLENGDVAAAAVMLGRPYSLFGVVVAGNRLGRTIGFPTANMQMYDPLKLIPAGGVYAVEVETGGRELYGMTNIGHRPTLGSGNALTIETHIFDFDEQIYGLDLTIRFIGRIRDERPFPSLDALRVRLEADEAECRKLIANEKK